MTIKVLRCCESVSKTRVVCRLLGQFTDLKVRGFYTRGTYDGHRRLTYECIMLPRERYEKHTLASRRERFPGDVFVGSYSVNVPFIDKVLVPYLKAVAADTDVLIVDEIGKIMSQNTSFRSWFEEIIISDIKADLLVCLPHRVQDDLISALHQRVRNGTARRFDVTWTFSMRRHFGSALYKRLGYKKTPILRLSDTESDRYNQSDYS